MPVISCSLSLLPSLYEASISVCRKSSPSRPLLRRACTISPIISTRRRRAREVVLHLGELAAHVLAKLAPNQAVRGGEVGELGAEVDQAQLAGLAPLRHRQPRLGRAGLTERNTA